MSHHTTSKENEMTNKLLTPLEAAQVLANGGEVQRRVIGGQWADTNEVIFNKNVDWKYREKPKPAKPPEGWVNKYGNAWNLADIIHWSEPDAILNSRDGLVGRVHMREVVPMKFTRKQLKDAWVLGSTSGSPFHSDAMAEALKALDIQFEVEG